MEITLKIDGKDEKFTAPFVSTRKLKDTLKLSEKVQKGFTVETMDDLEIFIVDLYDNKFTRDDLLDGYPAQEFFNKALSDMQRVMGNFDTAIKN